MQTESRPLPSGCGSGVVEWCPPKPNPVARASTRVAAPWKSSFRLTGVPSCTTDCEWCRVLPRLGVWILRDCGSPGRRGLGGKNSSLRTKGSAVVRPFTGGPLVGPVEGLWARPAGTAAERRGGEQEGGRRAAARLYVSAEAGDEGPSGGSSTGTYLLGRYVTVSGRPFPKSRPVQYSPTASSRCRYTGCVPHTREVGAAPER